MENEEWRDIPGYEGFYQVSNLGRVKRIKAGHGTKSGTVLKTVTDSNGYILVGLCKNAKQQLYLAHRLVAQAFIPNSKNKPEIDHIDGNRQNNYVNNLRWVTHKENINNPYTIKKIGRAHIGKYGILHPKTKPIVCIDTGRLFSGIYEATRELKINKSSISSALTGRYKTAGGYRWRYAMSEEFEQIKNI